MIRTISEMARAAGLQQSAPPAAFAESLMYAACQHNRLPTKGNPRSTPPLIMAWPSQEPTSLECFRPFWSPVYVHKLPSELPRRAKADARAYCGRFVGFSTGIRGHRVLVRGETLHRADVIFNECDSGPTPPHDRRAPAPASVLDTPEPQPLPHPSAPAPPSNPNPGELSEPLPAPAARPPPPRPAPNPAPLPRPEPPPSRGVRGLARVSPFPLRERMPRVPHNAGSAFAGRLVGPDGYGAALAASSRCTPDYHPTSHKDAMSCPDRELWAGAERKEMARSEERRVGKECRSRWSPYH